MLQYDTIGSTICDFEEEIGKALITTKALPLYRPGEACGLLESTFQPMVQGCGSFRSVVTFGNREYPKTWSKFSQCIFKYIACIFPVHFKRDVNHSVESDLK